LHEHIGSYGIASGNQPAGDEFRIGAKRRPSSHIPKTELTTFFDRHILALCIAERPDFIRIESACMGDCETRDADILHKLARPQAGA